MPEARKAMVHSPVSSKRSISSCSFSANPDSESPQVRSVRLLITAVIPARALRSGSTHSPTICCISQGTPGTAYTALPLVSTLKPGAVPGITGSTSAPSGTSAWRRLFSGMARPRPPKTVEMRSTMSSRRTSSTPRAAAITSRVMSSWVGPSPPHKITESLRSRAWLSTACMR